MTRELIFAEIDAALPDEPPRPLTIAVDGSSGAGKTTFADALAQWLRGVGYDVARRSVAAVEQREPHQVDFRAVRREVLATEDPPGRLLVVDGDFLQRDELAQVWDLAIYLDVPDEIGIARVEERDGPLGDTQRRADAQRAYRERCDPRRQADLVIDNTDVEHPRVAGEQASRWSRVGGHLVRAVRVPADRSDLAAAIDELAADGY